MFFHIDFLRLLGIAVLWEFYRHLGTENHCNRYIERIVRSKTELIPKIFDQT